MNVLAPQTIRRRRAVISGLVLALTLLNASLVSAQPSAGDSPRSPHGRGHGGHGGHGGPGGPGHGPAQAVVRALDTDRDQVLSAAELLNAATSLRTLDTNGDGAVTMEDLRPGRPADASANRGERPERPRPFNPVMLALDADEDGALSASEIANATASLQALDLNGDGQLTMDEFRPTPPEGARSRKGPRPAERGAEKSR